MPWWELKNELYVCSINNIVTISWYCIWKSVIKKDTPVLARDEHCLNLSQRQTLLHLPGTNTHVHRALCGQCHLFWRETKRRGDEEERRRGGEEEQFSDSLASLPDLDPHQPLCLLYTGLSHMHEHKRSYTWTASSHFTRASLMLQQMNIEYGGKRKKTYISSFQLSRYCTQGPTGCDTRMKINTRQNLHYVWLLNPHSRKKQPQEDTQLPRGGRDVTRSVLNDGRMTISVFPSWWYDALMRCKKRFVIYTSLWVPVVKHWLMQYFTNLAATKKLCVFFIHFVKLFR